MNDEAQIGLIERSSDERVAQPAPSIYGEGDSLNLGAYAQQAYLEYALSVVKGRALPDVCDGQKPVQRRILYAMQRLGLGFGGSNGANGAKPVKSARVVGDVLGRYHPHSDQAAYDAMVRMAQDFSQRYPLVDGQGNFGSRDGDGAAAMRYTEARLSKISTLLLDEIDEGTVDFVPNYDGSTEEPRQLPARLPFVLLNGASGIAVGMATEIPSHNLAEVAAAAVALIKNEHLADSDLLQLLPAPDFPGGGQIISSPKDIADIYASGRGSLKVRARWTVEELARGQWQLVVHELPPATSTQKVLEEIEELTNPKLKSGKKSLTAEQLQLKASVLNVLDTARDESNKDAAVRLVLEPKSSRVDVVEFMATLLAHTSLESSVPVNLTMVGLDGKPVQKNLRQMLTEWIAFREKTVQLRSRHRLEKVLARIHILEGRQIVLLNIDEVIRIIRESDEPKPALIEAFRLSERQAEDILEIRLRQLARLEAIKIEQELANLRQEQAKLEDILGSVVALRRLMVKEIEADAKQFGDARRTLVQEEKRTVAEIKVVDEAVTVIVSSKGWVRTQKGHGLDAAGFVFKSGDTLYGSFECRSVDTLIAWGHNGRVYSVAVAQLPGGRGDGQPISTLIELEAKTQIVHYYAGAASDLLLLAGASGYGFMARVEHMVSRQKAGKAFVSLEPDEALCTPSVVPPSADAGTNAHDLRLCCVTKSGRLLAYPLSELRVLQGGGRGLMLIALEDADSLVATAMYTAGQRLCLRGLSRSGKAKEEILEPRILEAAMHKRAKKGKATNWGFTPQTLTVAAPKPAKPAKDESTGAVL